MKSVLVNLLLVVAVMILAIWFLPKNTHRYYNCELAEISPDFPLAVKQQCRELRTKK